MLLKIITAISRVVELSPRRNIQNDQECKMSYHSCSRKQLMGAERERERERERKRETGWKGGGLIDAALKLSRVNAEILSRVLIIQLTAQNKSPSWNSKRFSASQ